MSVEIRRSSTPVIDVSRLRMKFRMAKLTTQLRKLWRDELGQDLTEYALLVVLIALASVLAIGALAGAISNTFTSTAANLTST